MVREPASERAGIRAERFLMIESHKTPLTILLASPRGFCAGGAGRLGIMAGASAPEPLVDQLVAACGERFDVAVEEMRTTEESVVFKLPRTLVA
jgi:hypothetical protein